MPRIDPLFGLLIGVLAVGVLIAMQLALLSLRLIVQLARVVSSQPGLFRGRGGRHYFRGNIATGIFICRRAVLFALVSSFTLVHQINQALGSGRIRWVLSQVKPQLVVLIARPLPPP